MVKQSLEDRVSELEARIKELQSFCGVLGPLFEAELLKHRLTGTPTGMAHARHVSESRSRRVDAQLRAGLKGKKA
jgi:hypothetical protein